MLFLCEHALVPIVADTSTAFDSKAEKAEPVPIIADNIKNYKSSYLLAVWLAPFKCSNFFL